MHYENIANKESYLIDIINIIILSYKFDKIWKILTLQNFWNDL